MIKQWTLRFVAVALLLRAAPAQAQSFSLSSPNGQITATIKISGGNLVYNLTRGGQSVIDDSRLGLIINNGSAEDLGLGISSLTGSAITNVNTTYPVLGWHPTAVNNYNSEIFTTTKTGSNNDSAVEFRVFNDGLAFRYTLPTEGGASTRTVLGEATQWKFPTAAASGWYQAGANADYANTWSTATPVSGSSTDLEGEDRLLGPVVVSYGTNGSSGYTAVGESDNWGYSGLTYVGGGNNTHTIKAAFIQDTSWTEPSGSTSPWRTIVTAPNLNGLVNSDMTTNVARAPDPTLYPGGVNTSWITTGRSLWSWLDKKNVNSDLSPATGAGINVVNMEQYVDEAQKLGFEYVTIDSGWKGWNGGGDGAFVDLGNVVSYAHARGIKIIAWKDSNDFYSGDVATGTFDNAAAASFLDQLHAVNVDGVKMDFLRQTGHLVGENQRVLNFMTATYQAAASRQMLLDFHGAPKDAGQNRTYPNALTTEDLRGLESGALAAHDATLPFTTLLSGPSDYTPGLFSDADDPSTTTFDENGQRNSTTWVHQMAMGVLISSPIIHWASGPNTITDALPDGSPQLDVFKNISSTWDQTKVLDISQIGVLAAFARQDGNRWFLAMVNGDGTNPKSVTNVDLSFLGNSHWDATLLFDDSLIDEQFDSTLVHSLTSAYDLDVTMLRGGGFVAMFTMVPEPATFGLFAILMAVVCWCYRRSRTRTVLN